jgi:hypothetical protein
MLGIVEPGVSDFNANIAKKLRQSLGLSDYREEIRVITPPGHDMLVQMRGNTRPCYLTLVHTNVEAVGSANSLENSHGLLG